MQYYTLVVINIFRHLNTKFSLYFPKVLVHNPQAYPEMNGKSVVIESGKENFISVSASHTKG